MGLTPNDSAPKDDSITANPIRLIPAESADWVDLTKYSLSAIIEISSTFSTCIPSRKLLSHMVKDEITKPAISSDNPKVLASTFIPVGSNKKCQLLNG